MKENLINTIKNSAYIVIIAICLAYFEVQIEGPNGWASALPTWRYDDPSLTWIFGGRPITGYHTALNILLLLFFHWPFILKKWNILDEIRILSSFTILAVIWDFLWFVINPYFGLEKYNSSNIWWFKNWLSGFPVDYYFGILVTFVIRGFSALLLPENKLRGLLYSTIFIIFCILGIVLFVVLFHLWV
jgi:hypothetical protein